MCGNLVQLYDTGIGVSRDLEHARHRNNNRSRARMVEVRGAATGDTNSRNGCKSLNEVA